MTTFERWRLRCGCIATIDLEQTAGAVEVLRDSLSDAGAVRLNSESALEAWRGFEGGDQTSIGNEGERS